MLSSFDFMLEGICISDLKARILNEWPVPNTVKYVQLFLGFIQYFLNSYAILMALRNHCIS